MSALFLSVINFTLCVIIPSVLVSAMYACFASVSVARGEHAE